MIIKELGTRLGLDTGTLTPLLRRMENDGWLTRERDTVDGRKVFISLTSKGRLMEEKVKDSVQSCFSHMAMNEAEYVENVVKLQAIAADLAQNNTRLSERN
ncbi:organic hydroperoxide resistance transcriptional regulator [Ligilactobacillus equi DPC 6820]|uniref:Organic hydroperoxide resistance transcriptional regulator n=2 Tax=Ligilactobacillus equi TaxID=137357 RepID=V7HYU7_9LACO|nr:organic hydroperoxide resistance transcriptional regulator [Ligilactobacillus equi DPC 6820]